MCGIFVSMGEIEPDQMDDILDLLHHRGPDEGKSIVLDNVTLGHRRLSIIGFEDGIQPIHNKEKDQWIVCNGEFYNYASIKEQLRQETDFLTHSDSEVALKLVETRGVEAIDQLDGMFAFFIADQKN